VGRVSLDLGSQAIQVRVHRVLVSFVAAAPYGIEKLGAAENPVRMLGKP
jgi:hypothetical protein